MLGYVPRALLTATVALTAAACAAGATGGSGSPDGGAGGGRYRVLIPNLEGTGGDNVAKTLRSLVSNMATHTAVPESEIRGAMKKNNVAQLDEITARQLAQVMGAQLVAWGNVQQGGNGLQSDIKFIDVRSGDEIVLDDVTGSDPRSLAQAVFQGFEQKVEGIRQAVFCNDYVSSQQFERAIENCEQALAIVPTSTTALYGKATALLNLERYDEALATYKQALEVDPTHQDALLGAGLAASRQNLDEAAGYYTRYMELNPGDVTVRMKVAGDIAKTGDYVSAFRILQPAAAENADNLDYQQYLAQVATAAGQKVQESGDAAAAREYFDTALPAYERVIAARPDSLDANVLRQVVAVYLAADRTNDALRVAQQATQKFDTVAGVWSTYASVLNKADRPAEEARALTRALELDPQLENGRIRLGLAHNRAGNRQAALAAFEQAAGGGNRENVAKAIFSMAADPLRRNAWSEAESLLTTAMQYAQGSTRSDVSFFLGLSRFRQGETIAKANTQGNPARAREAVALFQRALQPLQASNHQQAAQVLQATQQYIANQEAIIKAARS
jgi:tetratricopeptide (TPR) repeat protein